jgi:hypothetical protein
MNKKVLFIFYLIFANIYPKDFILQDYLSLKLPVNITRELTKLRLSSHPVLIDKIFRGKQIYNHN